MIKVRGTPLLLFRGCPRRGASIPNETLAAAYSDHQDAATTSLAQLATEPSSVVSKDENPSSSCVNLAPHSLSCSTKTQVPSATAPIVEFLRRSRIRSLRHGALRKAPWHYVRLLCGESVSNSTAHVAVTLPSLRAAPQIHTTTQNGTFPNTITSATPTTVLPFLAMRTPAVVRLRRFSFPEFGGVVVAAARCCASRAFKTPEKSASHRKPHAPNASPNKGQQTPPRSRRRRRRNSNTQGNTRAASQSAPSVRRGVGRTSGSTTRPEGHPAPTPQAALTGRRSASEATTAPPRTEPVDSKELQKKRQGAATPPAANARFSDVGANARRSRRAGGQGPQKTLGRGEVEDPVERVVRASPGTQLRCQKARTTAAPSGVGKTEGADGSALRQLLRDHSTLRRNFETMGESAEVARALERLCAESLAHGGLVEAVAEAFSATEAGEPSAAATTATARLVLTYLDNGPLPPSPVDGASAAHQQQQQELPGHLAAVTVPLSVAEWLSAPLVVPAVTLADIAACVERQRESVSTAVASTAVCGSGGTPATPFVDHSCALWYTRWGEQQLALQRSGAPGTVDAPSPPERQEEACKTLWSARQAAVSEALLSRVLGRSPAQKAHRSGSVAQPVGTVSEEMVPLLRSLDRLLRTLIYFKTRGEERRFAPGAAAAPFPDAESRDPTAASVRGPVDALAQLQRAILDLRQARSAGSAAAQSAKKGEGCAATAKAVSAAQERVHAAVDHCRSFVSCVDVLCRVPEPLNVAPLSARENGREHTSTHSARAPAPVDAGVYTAAALDLLMGVLMRCLLFFVPVLPIPARHFLMQWIQAPWLSTAQAVPALTWMTAFALTDVLITSGDVSRRLAKPTTPFPSVDHAPSHSAEVIYTSVQKLRRLCCPDVLFDASFDVRAPFDVLSLTANEACTTAARATERSGVCRNGSERASHLDELVAMRSRSVGLPAAANEWPALFGYQLLLFLLQVVGREDVMRLSLPHEGGSRGYGDSAAELRPSYTPAKPRRLLNRVWREALYIDRLAGKHFVDHVVREAPQSSWVPSPLLGSCALQRRVPHALTRVALSALAESLVTFSTMQHPSRRQTVLDAVQRAVMSPVASALFTMQRCGGGKTNFPSAARVARSVEWRAASPALLRLNRHITQDVWTLLWNGVAATLSGFPADMRAMLLAAQDARSEPAQFNMPNSTLSTAASTELESVLRACWAELRELALLSAWLLTACHPACVAPSKDGAAATLVAVAEREAGIRAAFAECVKGVLAFCTEVDLPAGSIGSLLLFFSRRAADEPSGPLRDNAEDAALVAEQQQQEEAEEEQLLLRRLTQFLKSHLWTEELRQLVQTWVLKVRATLPGATPSLEMFPTDTSTAVESTDLGAAVDAPPTPALDCASLDGLGEADPCFRGWWRALEAEAAGLPSPHIYLLQVFAELKRMVAMRGRARVAAEERGERSEVSSSSLVVDAAAEYASTSEAAPPNCVDGDIRRTATGTGVQQDDSVMFSCAELVVLLRVLVSISMRGGLATSGVFGDDDSRSGHAAAVTSWKRLSIQETLSRIALHHAATAAPAATSTTPCAGVALEEEAEKKQQKPTGAASPPAVPSPVAEVEQVMPRVEMALLSSVWRHAADLPAASLLEAVWLGLYPIAQITENSTFFSSEGDRFCAQHALHAAILSNAQTRLVCSFLLFRHYSVLSMEDSATASAEELSENDCHEVGNASSQLQRFARLLKELRVRCAEALAQIYVCGGARAADVRDVYSSRAVRQPSADGAGAGTDKESTETLTKDHARAFLAVFVLSSELHHSLRECETRNAPSLTTNSPANPPGISTSLKERQQMHRLYAALLTAVEEFVPLGERGRAVEVLQLMSTVTWRMRRQQILTLTEDDAGKAESATQHLLEQYRAVVETLMPQVQADALDVARSNSTTPLRMVMLLSAKAATEQALQGIPALCPVRLANVSTAAATASTSTEHGDDVAPSVRGAPSGTALLSSLQPPTSPPSLMANSLWPPLPWEQLMHRITSASVRPSRHDMMSAVTVFAPTVAPAFVPVATQFYVYPQTQRGENLLLTFMSLAVCATTVNQQNEQDMQSRFSGSCVQRAVLSIATGALDTGNSVDVDGERLSRHLTIPVYRSDSTVPTNRQPPMQLRRAWISLVRGMLEHEDDGAPSVWVSALYCGGVVGLAETRLFEQLLSCFVFNSTSAAGRPDDEGYAMKRSTTRIAQLNAGGWTLVIQACAMALDHHHRQAYRALLQEELVTFLTALDARSVVSACRSAPSMSPLDAMLLTEPALCGLLEALPTLFIADVELWATVVKPAVTRCCDGSADAAVRCEGSEGGGVTQWAEQWKRSFNWAVTCAGHPALTFGDVSTAEATPRSEVEALMRGLEEGLRDI